MTDDIVCNELSQDLSHFNLNGKDEGSWEDPLAGNTPCESNSLEEERLILQPNTVLERHLVLKQFRQIPLYNGEGEVCNLLALNDVQYSLTYQNRKLPRS